MVEQVRLHNNRIEELVTQLKQLNQRLTALEGQLLRTGRGLPRCTREEFLREYRGHELDPNWLERVGEAARQGLEAFVAKHAERRSPTIRAPDRRGGERRRPADRRVPPRLHDGAAAASATARGRRRR